LAIVRILEPYVERIVLANAKAVRAITSAKAKTDKIDAHTLDKLLDAGLSPRSVGRRRADPSPKAPHLEESSARQAEHPDQERKSTPFCGAISRAAHRRPICSAERAAGGCRSWSVAGRLKRRLR